MKLSSSVDSNGSLLRVPDFSFSDNDTTPVDVNNLTFSVVPAVTTGRLDILLVINTNCLPQNVQSVHQNFVGTP